MSNLTSDELRERVLLGLKEGRKAAVARARETGTLLVIWQDGKVVEVTPDEFERLHAETTSPAQS